MPDPNVLVAKSLPSAKETFDAHIDMGLLPLVPQSTHPTIVHRWNISHVIVMVPGNFGDGWRHYIWADAWVHSLLTLRGAWDLLKNAFTTLQENKPAILELKMLYEEALANPEKRLALLTEHLLSLRNESEAHYRGLNAAIHKAQKELDET